LVSTQTTTTSVETKTNEENVDPKSNPMVQTTVLSENNMTKSEMTRAASAPANKDEGNEVVDEVEEDLFQVKSDQWRCACEGGFLPPGLLKSFGAAEAVMRLGTGQCYHKQG
jgi:hypothetical protein